MLIVDEAHAYDAYMTTELRRLLHFHAALGGSAIVLSATLTHGQRTGLAHDFRLGLRAGPVGFRCADYPLATVVAGGTASEQPVGMADAMRRRVTVERVASIEAAADALVAAAASCGAVAWVRNTVDDAIAAHGLLAARGLDPILFHARFAMGDRLAIEREVLNLFGKTADPRRRRGQVLVATQVIEQSLDLDFDLMVSDLAPADLVIQRAGRIWRHKRPSSERPVAGPRLLLFAPEPVDDPPSDWLGLDLRGTGAVYRDTAMLWRSARALFATGAIVTPDNIRALVEAAIDPEAEEPAAFAQSSRHALGREASHKAIARQNVLVFDKPYQRDAGAWEPDFRTPTRLEEDERITLRLARIENGRAVPLFPDPNETRAWALSELSVRAAQIDGVAHDQEADRLLEAARSQWRRWELDIPVLLLRGKPEGPWEGHVLRKGTEKIVTYDRTRGMIAK